MILVQIFHLGLVGLCLGFILGRLILSLGYPWFIGSLLQIPPIEQLKGLPRPLLVTVGLFGMALNLTSSVSVTSWLGLVIATGSTALGVAVLAFYLGLSASQRASLWQRVLTGIRPRSAV
jgi:hypothetical protein